MYKIKIKIKIKYINMIGTGGFNKVASSRSSRADNYTLDERVVHAQSLAPVKLGCAANHTCLGACFCWVLEKPKSVMATPRRGNLSTEKEKEKKRAPVQCPFLAV